MKDDNEIGYLMSYREAFFMLGMSALTLLGILVVVYGVYKFVSWMI